MADPMRMVRVGVRVIGVISLVSSVAFLALGAYFYNRAVNFKKNAVETQGKVIELREGASGYPVIRFADKGGQDHTLYSPASYPPAYAVGDRAPILYDPANPNDAKVNSFTGLWLLPLSLGIIGGLDLFTGLFLLVAVPLILAWAERRTKKAST